MNNKTKSRAALAGGLLAAALLGGVKRPALADEAPTEAQSNAALQSRIDALEKQLNAQAALLEELKKQQATLQKNDDKTVKSKLPVTVSGTVQVEGLARLNESGPAARTSDTFRLRRGQIKLQAQVTPRIGATAMFDIAKVQDGNDRASDTVLQDLYISYLLNQSKDKKNANYIDAGQQKVPIGYEGSLSASALPFVERSLLSQLRDPLRAAYETGRDTGVQLRGAAGKFDYRLGVFNGFGDRQNTLAFSDAKAVIGRLAYNVTSDWQVGASAARGDTGINAAAVRADRHLWNAFTAYKHGKFSFQGEYTKGDYSDPTGALQNIRGYYGNVGYFLAPKLEGVARADFFNYENLDAAIKQYTLGLNYYLKGNNAKLQLNWVHTDGDPTAPGTTFDNDSDELRTLLQVAF
jgi:hypothetical protein